MDAIKLFNTCLNLMPDVINRPPIPTDEQLADPEFDIEEWYEDEHDIDVRDDIRFLPTMRVYFQEYPP